MRTKFCRFGLHTKYGRGLTAKSVQPVCNFQQVFQSTCLFGAFSPITGNQFQLELPECSANTFQLFLNQFSEELPNEYKIIVLDNGAFHKAQKLIIPKNIYLLFLPPYSPELNPAEKVWQHLKRKFTNKHFKSLDEISFFFTEEIKKLRLTYILWGLSKKFIQSKEEKFGIRNTSKISSKEFYF